MKRFVTILVVVFGAVLVAWAESPATPTSLSLRDVHALTNDEASKGLPVAFEATVTYFPGYEHLLFVQDGDIANFVLASTTAKLVPGDRILVKGKTQESFHPIVVSSDITVLHHGALPKPIIANFGDLILGQRDCMLVTVRAVVRSAELRVINSNVRNASLEMLTDRGYIDATVESDDENALKGLLDSEVEVTGVAGGKFDGKMQQTGILLHVSSLADVKVLKRAATGLQSIPVTPFDQILAGYHVQDLTQRVRVHGTITYYEPGSAVVLQSGAKSLWIATPARSSLQVGDVVDATGFPNASEGSLALTHAEIEDSDVQAPIAPLKATWKQLAFWSSNKPEGHEYDLVSIEGQVVTEVREAMEDEYILDSDGQLFTAVYRHPSGSGSIPPMKQVPIGTRIRATGICMIEDTNPFNTSEQAPFKILLRSFDDVAVVASPSLLNVRNLIILVALLIVVVVAIGARGWAIEHRTRRQTAALAYLEQRRSHILEDINGSRPLAEIIEEITELVSFRLRGVPCWCQITDGARLGSRPTKLDGLRVVELEIPSRSSLPLGTIFAAFDKLTKPSAIEMQTLSMAVGLAALAIETRRLYSDLVHRSEFDLLTDIHNRFSLDKQLEHQIREVRETAGIFGLIYIDLDKFKQVNDTYGHHVGDLYLQEAADRMKRQLRPHDKLARLGGDEFAALVPLVRSRADVEEIARRLERCFDDPFVFEGHTLYGSASVGIALFPEDATTVDALLSAADATMYVAKYGKEYSEEMAGSRQSSTLLSHDHK
jgi:diguanylate cyclase (GGDEF)-like protein